MITITYFMLAMIPTVCLLLGMLVGTLIGTYGQGWVVRLYERLFIPIPLRDLPHRVRAMVKQARAHPVPMHTHTNVRYKGAHYGYLHIPAGVCIHEDSSPFPPGCSGITASCTHERDEGAAVKQAHPPWYYCAYTDNMEDYQRRHGL